MRATIRSKAISRAVVVVGLLMSTSTRLTAQAPTTTTLNPGTRVRITLADDPKPVVGSVVSFSADSISIVRASSRREERFMGAPAPISIARSAVGRLETSTGPHRRFWRGLAWGSGIGVTSGALLGALAYEPCRADLWEDCLLVPTNRTQSAAFGAALGGVFGALVGTVVGLVRQSDDWHPVGFDRVGQVRVMPTPHGVAASLTLPLGSSR